MNCLYLQPDCYTEAFYKKFLPKLIQQSLFKQIRTQATDYKAIGEQLQQLYGINLRTGINLCCRNFYTVKGAGELLCFKQNPTGRYGAFKIIDVYNFINDGNLSVRGSKLFYRMLDQIGSNPKHYYRMYILLKGKLK